jgi:hypothetical protein
MIKTFPHSWCWDYRKQEVCFCAWWDSNLVMCRVAREAIEDRYGNPPTPNACLEAARNHVNEIVDRISDLLEHGRF